MMPKLVRIVSPLSVIECRRRLADCTSRRGNPYYLRSRAGGTPEPIFRGSIEGEYLSVARFSETLGRNSFVAVMSGRISGIPDRGSSIVAAVGIAGFVRVFLWVFVILGTVILGSLFGAGIAGCISGKALPSIPFLLIPLIITAGALSLLRGGGKFVRTSAETLIREVCAVVDGSRLDA